MSTDAELRRLFTAIAAGDDTAALAHLTADPALARAALASGATRGEASDNFLPAIGHYVYAGDTALHVAATAHRPALVRELIRLGADPAAHNRRGATPLHYAADGRPGAPGWDPAAQAGTITALIAAGADPNAPDKSGVAPLHRAVRTRAAAAVEALLKGGADPRRTNRGGSTPLALAVRTTGRSGSGSAEAKAQQAMILEVLEAAGA